MLQSPLDTYETCKNATDSSAAKLLKWLLLPSWHGGFLYDVLRFQLTLPTSPAKRYDFRLPDRLPPMPQLRTVADVQAALAQSTSSAYAFVTEDSTTMPLATFLYDDDAHAARSSKGPMYSTFTENLCVPPSSPTGPLHPRTHLMMLYRADALAALVEAGVVHPDAAVPSDWDSLVALLAAHRRMVQLLLTQQPAGNASVHLALPRHGLCLNADGACGRVGDLFAAIAASIIQVNGTGQGFFLDLSLPPPAARTLFGGAGWRRAAQVLSELLTYNAPASASAAAADVLGYDAAGGPSCHAIGSQTFNTGDCMLTFEYEAVIGMASVMEPIMNKLGVAPLPGSRVVAVASASGESIVPCTTDLCAMSYNHDVLYLQPTLEGAEAAAAAALGADVRNISHVDDDHGGANEHAGSRLLPEFAAREAAAVARLRQGPGAARLDLPPVNRAPFSVTMDLAINIRYQGSDAATTQDVIAMQQAVAHLLDDTRSARQAAMDELRKTVGFGANGTRDCSGYAHGDWWRVLAPSRGRGTAVAASPSAAPSPANGTPPWRPWAAWSADAGPFAGVIWTPDVPGQAAGYLHTLWHAVHHPNAAPHPRSPLQMNLYRHALSYAAMALLPASYNNSSSASAAGGTPTGGGVETALAELDRAWALIAAAVDDPALVRSNYEAGISAPQYTGPQGSGDEGSSNSLGTGAKAAIGAAVGAAGLMVLVVGVLFLLAVRRRRQQRHRDLLGRVMAPKEGPDTTLLITDVQNSTVLWEQLPVTVMDVVLKLHHSTIRNVLARHDGYESATEGDSFIVAFATPAAALAFATSCQVELLHQDWPPQLLDHADGKTVLVLSPHDPSDPRDGRAVSTLAALGFIASSGPSSRAVFPGSSPAPGGRSSTANGYREQRTASGQPASAAPVSRDMRDSKDLSRDGDLRLSASNNLAGSGANNAQPSHSLLQILTAVNPNSRRQQRGSKTGMTGAGAAAAATASGSPMTTAEALAAADEDASLAVSCTWGDMLEAAFPLLLADSPEGRRVHALLRAGTMHSGDAVTEAGDEEGQEGDGWGAAAVATQSVAAMERAPVLRLPDWRVAVVAYRGLRVRMGLHSGLTDPAQVAFNRVVSSYAYKGDFAEVAKLVSDAAPGGLITLSHYAFARLRHTEPGSAAPAPGDPSHHHHHHHHHHADRRGSIDRRTSRDQGHPHLLDGLFRIGHGRDDHAAKDGGLQGAVVLYAGTHVLTEPKPRTVISKLLPAVRSRVALTLLGEGATPHASTPQAPLTPSETTLGSGPGLGPGPVAEALEFSRVDEATPHVQHHQQSIPEDGPPAYDRPTLLHGAPLESTDDPHALFLAAHPSLLCRLALRPQLRVVRTLKLGSLGAPVRRVTVAFMKVVGASVILADLPGPGARALDAFQRITGTLLAPGGGFKVEGADGLVLAVFGSPMAAVRWACTCSAALAQYAWEEALLSHELCQEEVGVAAAAELSGCHAFGPGSQSPRGTLRRQPCGPLLQAGPRIKVGLDIGTTTHTLTSASGRLSYRGKPMNRAARIAGIGAAGQVLCSGDTWEACAAEDPRLLDRYSGVSLGCMALKGVAQPLEVVQVLPEAATFG